MGEGGGGYKPQKVVHVKKLYKRFHSSINVSLKFSGTAAPPHIYMQVAYIPFSRKAPELNIYYNLTNSMWPW
jgi:hypothetical protein